MAETAGRNLLPHRTLPRDSLRDSSRDKLSCGSSAPVEFPDIGALSGYEDMRLIRRVATRCQHRRRVSVSPETNSIMTRALRAAIRKQDQSFERKQT
jgi:hypothetical protein